MPHFKPNHSVGKYEIIQCSGKKMASIYMRNAEGGGASGCGAGGCGAGGCGTC